MATVEELQRELETLREENNKLSSTVDELSTTIDFLRAQIHWFKRRFFGSKSERIDSKQIALALGFEEESKQTPKQEEVTYKRRKPAARREPPAEAFKHLPVEETVEILPEEVKADRQAYEEIGAAEETFEVDMDPPRFYRRKIRRPKFRKKGDKSRPPVVAAAPKRPVEGSFVSVNLLVYVIICKYLDHLPLARQQRIYRRYGVELSRKTMADWIRIVALWLKSIYDYMHSDLISGDYLQVDDTPIRFQDRDFAKGKCSQGYFVAVSRPGGDVVFTWSKTRTHESINMAIKGFRGRLQSDAYGAYLAYAQAVAGVILIGCWAHARRYFEEAKEENPREVARILVLIGHLYLRERRWKEQELNAEETRKARQKKSKPTVNLLKRIFERLQGESLPKSRIGKACYYALNNWEAHCAFLEHGDVEIDDNLVENLIRPSAQGKKNWLFIGHPEAGERSAIIYSIILSCQRHGVDPAEYLRYALNRLPNATTSEIASMTPKAYADMQSAVTVKEPVSA